MLVAVAILLGLVALLAVPLEAAFRLDRVAALEGEVQLRWLFGLVRVRLAVPRPRARAAEAAAGPKAARKRERREGRGGAGRGLAVLRQAEFRERVRRLVGDLVRALHVRRLLLHVRMGLGDPADTGLLWALVGPLGAVAAGSTGGDVRIEPDFLDSALELHSRGEVRIVPLRILALAVGFALSPPSIRAWRTWRTGEA